MSPHPLRPWRKFGLLASLYFAQGLPYGFFTQALPSVMRQQGISLKAIGLSSLLAIPWAAKFLWAPFVENRYSASFGRRRSWLVPLQLASALAMGLLAFADPSEGLVWLIVGVLVTNLIAATQDISTDGLAVDLLSVQERGIGNGIQVAGYRVGMIFGGGALLVAFDHYGWAWTFLCAAGALVLASAPVLAFNEPPPVRVGGEAPVAAGVRDALRTFWADPTRRRWLGILGLYKAGDYLGTSMLRPFFVDKGQTLGDIGVLLGGWGFGAGLLGAAFGALFVNRIGRWRALVGFGVLQGMGVATYALTVDPSAGGWPLYGPIIFEHFVTGMATVALFTLMMDFTRPDHAATDYTLQASWVVCATGIAAALGGTTADWLGYQTNFLLGGAFCLVAALWSATGRDARAEPLSDRVGTP